MGIKKLFDKKTISTASSILDSERGLKASSSAASANKVTKTSVSGADVAKTLGKNTIVTAGVTTGVLGTANILKDTKLFQSTATTTTPTTQTVDPEEVISDEDKRSIIEEIITRLQGGSSGGTTAVIGGDGYGETSTSTFSEALSTIKQYLPWILGGMVVLFIAYMATSSSSKTNAEAVKA